MPSSTSRSVLLLIVFCALAVLILFSGSFPHHSFIHEDDQKSHENNNDNDDNHVTMPSIKIKKLTTKKTKPTSRIHESPSLSSSTKNTFNKPNDENNKASVENDPEAFLIDPLPPKPSFIEKVREEAVSSSPSSSVVKRQIQNGMQPKYYVENIGVKNNKFYFFTSSNSNINAEKKLPPKIYLPDGQIGPMKQNHKYTGHDIKFVSSSLAAARCKFRVKRPTVFLYRMSGHSTYHLWENNLGPFYQSLLDFQNEFSSSSSSSMQKNALLDPSQLLIAFTDNKPRKGPKNPHLLDQLLRTFSDTPLLNASRIDDLVCFDKAILGISANSYRMRPLVELMKKNILTDSSSSGNENNQDTTKSDPDSKPSIENINAVYISRNHPSIIRGRKIHNEAEFLEALNQTLLSKGVTRGVKKVFMEQMTYKEQVAFATTVDIMFSPHGGGVANCIWMKQKSVMVEFVAPVGKTLPNMYHSMCSRSGIQHFSFLADPDPDDEKNVDPVYLSNKRLFSNMVVPREKIVANAEKAVELWKKKNAV